jgi:uncharacterized membrane protein
VTATADQPQKRSSAQTLDRLLHPSEQQRIVRAIRTAELYTTGEIKVHVEARCPAADPYSRAVQLFEKLGVHRTDGKNGVLVYAAIHERRFALVADSGIVAAPDDPWVEARQRLSVAFRRGAYGEGIVGAVQSIGEKLTKRFPSKPGVQHDEVENEISTEDT